MNKSLPTPSQHLRKYRGVKMTALISKYVK